MLPFIANGTIITYIITHSLMTHDLRNIIEFGICLFSCSVTSKLTFIRQSPTRETDIIGMEQTHLVPCVYWTGSEGAQICAFDSGYQVKHAALHNMALMGQKGCWLLRFQSGMAPHTHVLSTPSSTCGIILKAMEPLDCVTWLADAD